MAKNSTFYLFICCFGLLLSCTVNIEPKPSLIQPPLVDQYPLKIGYYHNDRLKEHYAKNERDIVGYNYLLTDASTKLAESTLKAMFRSVEPLNNISVVTSNLDGVIVVEIERFVSPVANDALLLNQATIFYVFTLYDNKKLPLGLLRVRGMGTSDEKYLLNTVLQDAVELAMKDAMAQFMVRFAKNPRFKNWLNGHGVATQSSHER